MKALRYYDRNTLKVEEIPVPEIEEDEVLVETKACGICSSDILDWYREPRAPMFFGHEVTGTIVNIGKKVSAFSIGDRVFVHHHVPCMTCEYCASGNYSMCEAFRQSHLDPGGFSEYIRVPGENVRKGLIRLPDTLSFIEATFIEPLACCIQAVQRASLRMGDRVVIFGAGFNGLLLLVLSCIFGGENPIVVEPNSYRARLALELGARGVISDASGNLNAAVRDLNGGKLARVVFVTPPNTLAIQAAFDVVDRGGTILIYAPSPPGEVFNVDIFRIYFSQLTVRTSYSASPLETRQAVRFLEAKKEAFLKIPVTRYPFVAFEEAFSAIRKNPKVIKAVFDLTGTQ
ncbi:MAG: alcohol dehydrogenase catalytic domain-containing protein [Candidatus Caldatribacteriaceae bacterium]